MLKIYRNAQFYNEIFGYIFDTKRLTCYNSCSIIVVHEGGDMLNDKVLNIKIPSELYNRLKEEAQKKNISLAAIVRMICSEYFEKK